MKTFRTIFVSIITIVMIVTNVFAGNSLLETFENADNELVLRHNRYYYKTEFKYADTNKIVVSESEAQYEEDLRNIFAEGIGEIVGTYMGFGQDTHDFISNSINLFYKSPYSAAGTYYVYTYEAKRLRVDRLTGESRVVDRGYKFIIGHGEKEIERIYWY